MSGDVRVKGAGEAQAPKGLASVRARPFQPFSQRIHPQVDRPPAQASLRVGADHQEVRCAPQRAGKGRPSVEQTEDRAEVMNYGRLCEPLARQLAHVDLPAAVEPARALHLAELVERTTRKIAWCAERGGGVVRLELADGPACGTLVVTVSRGLVSVRLDGSLHGEPESLVTRLRAGLSRRGLAVGSIEISP